MKPMLLSSGTPHNLQAQALHRAESIRQMERTLGADLPAHELMTRAGRSAAALARAITPHARSIWIACGPGNNGGDGLMAAAFLAPWARQARVDVSVGWCGSPHTAPPDAHHAWELAVAAGVRWADHPPPGCDLGIDALLGIGARAPTQSSAQWDFIQASLLALHTQCGTRLSLDVPTGLCADTGAIYIADYPYKSSSKGTFCLTFIAAKPGLFTGHGRALAGDIWLDDLGWSQLHVAPALPPTPTAWLGIPGHTLSTGHTEAPVHHTHKGLLGDVWVLGGQGKPQGQSMAGAAILAARAALHAGTGRVLVALLDNEAPSWDAGQPELMLRGATSLHGLAALPTGVWVCGCGGGSAIEAYLPRVIHEAQALVLDADALNTVSRSADLRTALRQRGERGWPTVITPHPLEAARLLGQTTLEVQADRIQAAQTLASDLRCVCVLKGSGTVVASPTGMVCINPSGNGRLSTAGTGDVLAGVMGAALAAGARVWPDQPRHAQPWAWWDEALLPDVLSAVWSHGLAADQWEHPHAAEHTLTASELARRITPPASARFAAAPPAPERTGPPRPPAG